MPHVQATARLPVDADTLWRRIGSFQRVDWHPMLEKVEGEGEEPGAIRTPVSRDGHQQQREKLLEMNPREHFYRYAIVSTPMAAKNWVCEFRVVDNRDGTSTVVWMDDFDVEPNQEKEAVANIQGFLDAGVETLRKQYWFASPG